jgi:hypothetical protein
MTFRPLLSTVLALILAGCGATASIEKSWVDKDVHTKDLQGVLVVAVAPSADGRRAFEQDFTDALVKRGIHAVASYNYKGGTEVNKDDVLAMAAKAEVDTVLVTLFAGRDESEVLHPGRKYYSYAPVYGRDAYGRGRVYGVPYQVGQTSDFWAQHKSIHLTAKLYEVSTEELLWQAYSGMEEQSDVNAMRPTFIKSFVEDLAAQGLID